jgi:membrane-associated phospholipid phosphatase
LTRFAWVAAACLLLVPEGARAQEEEFSPSPGRVTSAPRDDGRRTLRRLPVNLARGAIGVLSGDNLVPLLLGGTTTAAASLLDERVADFVADPDHDFGQSLEDGARPELLGLVVAGVFTATRFVEAPRVRALSYDLLDAFLVNWAWTTAVKAAVGRERPNGEDAKSFPSGHASNAFALATVVERHYGWKGGTAAYAVASAVALSRLQRNKHYLSDVLAGATLGYVVGRTVVRVNGRPHSGTRAVQATFSPVLGRHTRAALLAISF